MRIIRRSFSDAPDGIHGVVESEALHPLDALHFAVGGLNDEVRERVAGTKVRRRGAAA